MRTTRRALRWSIEVIKMDKEETRESAFAIIGEFEELLVEEKQNGDRIEEETVR